MGPHNLTNQRTDLVAQYLKYCYCHTYLPEQSLLSKHFWRIASQNAFPKSRHPPLKVMTAFIVFLPLALRRNLLYMKITIFSGFSYFLVIFSASLSGSVNGAYSQLFYAIFQFSAKFTTLDRKPAIIVRQRGHRVKPYILHR